MRKVGLFEAKQKLSELVERASRGERIGISILMLLRYSREYEAGNVSLCQHFDNWKS